MNSKTTKRFRQMLAKLPSEIRQQAKEVYKVSGLGLLETLWISES